MKDRNGGFWCLEKRGGHIHTESNCPKDFKDNDQHIFRSIKNKNDANVPIGMCAIRSQFDYSLICTTSKHLEAGKENSPIHDGYLFMVNDVGNGKFSIFSVEANKFLKQDGHHAKPMEYSDCGENCHFTIEEIVYPINS